MRTAYGLFTMGDVLWFEVPDGTVVGECAGFMVVGGRPSVSLRPWSPVAPMADQRYIADDRFPVTLDVTSCRGAVAWATLGDGTRVLALPPWAQ